MERIWANVMPVTSEPRATTCDRSHVYVSFAASRIRTIRTHHWELSECIDLAEKYSDARRAQRMYVVRDGTPMVRTYSGVLLGILARALSHMREQYFDTISAR